MTRRAPSEVYANLIAAGFDPAAATVMTAIAGAESGYDNANLGDIGLQDNTWGPSYGLFQIRTLKAETGSGTNRDINRLAASDLEQARAAYAISGGGTNFSPWTVYNTGAYQQFLEGAKSAAGATSLTGDEDGPLPTVGPDWLPWNWPSVVGNKAIDVVGDAAGDAVDSVLGGVRHIVFEGLAVVAGVALLGVGVYTLAIRPARAKAIKAVMG